MARLTVRYVVTGGPDGDAVRTGALDDGALVDVAEAPPDPEVVLTVPAESARQVEQGDVDPSVLFMRGTMKVSGTAAGRALDVLPGLAAWIRSPWLRADDARS